MADVERASDASRPVNADGQPVARSDRHQAAPRRSAMSERIPGRPGEEPMRLMPGTVDKDETVGYSTESLAHHLATLAPGFRQMRDSVQAKLQRAIRDIVEGD